MSLAVPSSRPSDIATTRSIATRSDMKFLVLDLTNKRMKIFICKLQKNSRTINKILNHLDHLPVVCLTLLYLNDTENWRFISKSCTCTWNGIEVGMIIKLIRKCHKTEKLSFSHACILLAACSYYDTDRLAHGSEGSVSYNIGSRVIRQKWASFVIKNSGPHLDKCLKQQVRPWLCHNRSKFHKQNIITRFQLTYSFCLCWVTCRTAH